MKAQESFLFIPGFRRRRLRSRTSAARPARLHQVIFAGQPPTGERAEPHFLRWCALRVRLELEMEQTEREQEWESWAGFQIRTSFPGRHWLPHSYGKILRTSSPVVKRKIIAKLTERAKCRSRAAGASTLGGTGTWRVGPCMRGLGLPSRPASSQAATARSSGRGFLIGKDKNPRHNNRAVATRFVRHG